MSSHNHHNYNNNHGSYNNHGGSYNNNNYHNNNYNNNYNKNNNNRYDYSSHNTMKHKSYYSEEDFEDDKNKKPGRGIFLALLSMIPGSIGWLILAYYTPFASLTAIFIMIGAMLGFKIGANYMTYKTRTSLVIISSILMFALTTAVTAYTLYSQYNSDVLRTSSIDELRESFITNLKNNGKSTEETESMLKDKYGINGLNDIEGLNKLVKDTLADTYKDSHKVSVVPDSPFNAVICLFQSLAYNRTIAKPFFFNILGGIAIAILTSTGLIRAKYFKPPTV